MFYNVSSLLSISNESSFDISNIKDMNHMFYNCSSLCNLSGISQWNITNVIDMSYMFYNCSSLKIFDNIYYWKLNNVKNKENMLYGCKDNNIYLYSFKIYLYYLSFLIVIIFIYYFLFYKKYFFIYFIMPFFLLSFSTIFIQAIIPYYFIYLSLCKYELEKYLDNTKIYNDFIKINNNIEFFKEKKYLRYINIYSSIFYTPLLIICLMADSKEYFIKKKSLIILIFLFVLYLVTQIFNLLIFLRLNNTFQNLEDILNKEKKNNNNKINLGNFKSELQKIVINIIFIARALLIYCWKLMEYNNNNKNKNKKKY